MSDAQVVSQISALFAPYVKRPDELQSIRVRLAEYIESLKPRDATATANDGPIAILNHVTGIRRRYLQALQANIEAKRKYSMLQNELRGQNKTNTKSDHALDATYTHIERLRLQRQHQQYQILSHYLTEAEYLAEQNRIFDPAPASEAIPDRSTDTNTADESALAAKARELTRKLEIAILQANHQLKREAQLLEDIKARRQDEKHSSPDAKLHALVATRAELTAWIEESLAKCDLNHQVPAVSEADHTESTPNYIESINGQYEKYLDARKRLLVAATTLVTPLPPTQGTALEAASKPNNNRQASSRVIEPLTVLPHITSRHLPHLSERQALSQLQSHLATLVSTHHSTLLSQLHRLCDESHLLPSYPILAQDKPKFFSKHTRSLSGSNDYDVNNMTEADSSEMEVSHLLSLWQFAIEAAGTATEATVEKQVADGTKATNETKAIVEGIRADKAMWEKLVES